MKLLSLIKKNFKRYKAVIIIVLIIRIFLLLLTFTQNPQSVGIFFQHWSQWDGYRYTQIAEFGYAYENGRDIVWYPLYPMLIRIFNYITQNFYEAGVLLSIFFSFVASILLYKLVKIDFDEKTALKSVWFLNIFPTAYFLQAAYAESLYLTLILGSIYLVRKGKFLESGALGALANATRPYALTLIPILMLEAKNKLHFLSTKNVFKILLVALIAMLGFIFYLALNNYLAGEPFYFLKIYREAHTKFLSWPNVGISGLLYTLKDPVPIYTYAEILSLVLAAITLPLVYLKIRKSYALYIFLNLVIFTSTFYIIGTPRYILVLFPIFILFGRIRNKALFTLVSIVSGSLLIFYAHLFIQQKWAF